MDRITQEVQVVNLLPRKDINGAAFTTAYANMENYGQLLKLARLPVPPSGR